MTTDLQRAIAYTNTMVSRLTQVMTENSGGAFNGTMDDIPDGTTYVKTENNYTDADASKLAGIAAGAEVNVNADWNAGSGDAQILNKPTIPTVSDVAYGAGWNESTAVPTQNALYDKIQTMGGGVSLSDVYPIGSIYIETTGTNPATTFGFGTWSAFGAGRVPIGYNSLDSDFDTSEKTGGAKTVQSSAQTFVGTAITDVINHTHTVNITDNGHAHTQRYGAATGNFTVHVGDTSGGGTGGSATLSNEQTTTTNTTGITAATVNPAGGVASITPAGTNTPGTATSVVQPYIVVHMWKRTA